MSFQQQRPFLGSIVTILLSAPLLLALTQCGASLPPGGAEHCGGVACSSSYDCQAAAPACALAAGTGCLQGPPRECVWRLNTSSNSCPCMEHDVRLCDLSGSPGVQICM